MTLKDEQTRKFYDFGPFRIDAVQRILLREGVPVKLTPKLFDTLFALVRSGGRVVEKNDLMETVWPDTAVEESNLTSNVSLLRKILSEGSQTFIETLPRRGYRFVAEVRDAPEETYDVLAHRRRVSARIVMREEFEDDGARDTAAPVEEVRATNLLLNNDAGLRELLETRPNNIAWQLTPLIGREREAAQAVELLRSGGVRLVTMTGVGGTGKTRLSQEVAQLLLHDFEDGVFFIELASVRDAQLVASTIAQPLGVKESGGKSLTKALNNHLRDRHMLLVLDNFEQVTAAAPLVAELLASSRGLKILLTSRAPLRLSIEHEFGVPPLATPASDDAPASTDELMKFEAIGLFVERARAVKPNFMPTNENARSVAEICARLDGLPLAIELAAARIRLLSPQAISARLNNRLKLLTGGARDLPPRQQTIRGAIEWSYELLDDDEEKRLFRRLAVFAGGFTIEAAEALLSGRRPSQDEKALEKKHAASGEKPSEVGDEKRRFERSPQPAETLDLIASLLDNSLLARAEQAGGEWRFRMLEVVREYALEALQASGEGEVLRERHAAFFLALAEEAETEMSGEQGAKWLDCLEAEHDNLRAAFSWSAAHDAETAINLAAALRGFWILHNHLTEGRKWLEKALEQAGDEAPSSVRFKLLNGLGRVAGYQDDYETARKAHEECLATGRAANDLQQIVQSGRGLAFVTRGQGDFAASRKFCEEGLAISREVDDKLGVAFSLTSLGDLARMEDNYTAARSRFEESLAICRQLGNKQAVSGNLTNLGAVAYGEGDYAAARAHFAEGLAMARELGDKVHISYSLDGFAALAVAHGERERAVRLAGAAEHLRESLGFGMEPAERRFREAYLTSLRAALAEDAFALLYHQGRALKTSEAIALALVAQGCETD